MMDLELFQRVLMNFYQDKRPGMYKRYAEIFQLADIASGVICGGCAKTCKQKRLYTFQDWGQFSEKLEESLIYHANRLQISKNQWRWWLIGRDPGFEGFQQLIFATFSVGGSMRYNFGKLRGDLLELFYHKGIFYLLVFVDISISCFWPILPI